MSAASRIKQHIIAYSIEHEFTVLQVGKELGFITMKGKHYIFEGLVKNGFLKQLRQVKDGKTKFWVYKKALDFTIEDTKRRRSYQDGPMIALEDMDTFIFGGNAERIVDNLYFKTSGRV